MEENAIVFDIETKHTFDEVGGFEFREKLGVSYVGVYSYKQDRYFGFFEEELEKLEKILITEKPLMIGFNSINFDNPVMQVYMPSLDLRQLPQLDMLREVEKILGHRLKLDSLAQTTLGYGKSGDGLDAVRWYRQGKLQELAQYCIDDVAITKELYDYGARHGRIFYMTGGEKTAVAASWANEHTIPQMIDDAWKHHKQLKIEYIDINPESGEREGIQKYTIDILGLNGDQIDAFIVEKQEKQRLDRRLVWQIEDTGETSAHQSALF